MRLFLLLCVPFLSLSAVDIVTETPDGVEYRCDWRGFVERFGPRINHYGITGQFVKKDSSCWVMCADPANPNEDEEAILEHERAHRDDAITGVRGSSPRWRELLRDHSWVMSHSDINQHLSVK